MHVASHGNMDVFSMATPGGGARAARARRAPPRGRGCGGNLLVNVGEADAPATPAPRPCTRRSSTTRTMRRDRAAARANIHRETLLFDALVLRYGGAWCAETESPRMGASRAAHVVKAREVIHDWLRSAGARAAAPRGARPAARPLRREPPGVDACRAPSCSCTGRHGASPRRRLGRGGGASRTIPSKGVAEGGSKEAVLL